MAWDVFGPWKKCAFCDFFGFFRSMEKMAWDGPKSGREDFFLLIQTLPTFWAERIWILITFIFLFFGPQISGFPGPQISKFPDFQVPRFPNFQTGLGQGQAWAVGRGLGRGPALGR